MSKLGTFAFVATNNGLFHLISAPPWLRNSGIIYSSGTRDKSGGILQG